MSVCVYIFLIYRNYGIVKSYCLILIQCILIGHQIAPVVLILLKMGSLIGINIG